MSTVQTYRGVEYVDVRVENSLLPESKKLSAVGDKWDRVLLRVGIPFAVCRYTELNDVNRLKFGRGSCKSIWVPKTIWERVRSNQPVRLTDIPEVDELVRPDDGYVDAKKLCSLDRKPVYHALKSVKKFSDALETEVKTPVIIKDSFERTWIHPRLADCIAMSGSVEFAVAATRWIQVARHKDDEIAMEHTRLLQNAAKENVRDHREVAVRDKLHMVVGGLKEVELPGMRCDIVTDSTVIEVKHALCLVEAASAIGQVSLYKAWFPSKAKRVHLFGSEQEVDTCRKCSSLANLALHNGVEVTYEIDRE